MKKTARISLLLILTILINMLNISAALGDNQDPNEIILKVYTDRELLEPGKKGAEYDIDYIKMIINANEANISPEQLNKIKLYTQGSHDQTDKFNISYSKGLISFELKYSHIQTYQLKKHTLYTIHIPQGIFTDKTTKKYNGNICYSFVTKTDDSLYPMDILETTYPNNEADSIDKNQNKIIFEFIDDIYIEPDKLDNIKEYITIESKPIGVNMPSYAADFKGDDNISNYIVSISGNKLILESKKKALKDFAQYTINLKKDIIYLRNSPIQKIYNDARTLSFTTDKMLLSSFPENNQENIELEPTLRFIFKYPMEILDKNKITLTSDDAEPISLIDRDKIIYDSYKNMLLIRLDDHEGDTYPLRKSTVYKISLKAGALAIKGCETPEGEAIKNHDMEIFFITRGEGEGPLSAGYHSTAYANDDIRYADKTNLDKDGSIYIKFDRPIKFDKSYEYPEGILSKIKLCQMPKWEQAYDREGKAYDERIEFIPRTYPGDQFDPNEKIKIVPSVIPTIGADLWELENEANLQELIIDKAEIVSGSLLKITPLEPLYNLNKYKLHIDKSILEDTNDYNTPEDIIFTFWTIKSEASALPKWKSMSQIKAEDIKVKHEVPYKAFQVYGVPQYSPQNPIIMDFEGEIIPNWSDEIREFGAIKKYTRISYDSLNQINLIDTHNPDEQASKIGMGKYTLQYYYEAENKHTRLLLYPMTVLDRGKEYNLKIPQGVFTTRGRIKIPTFEVDFTIEGDLTDNKEIFSMKTKLVLKDDKGETFDLYLDDNTVNITYLHYGELDLILNGYNFNERIQEAELVLFGDNDAGLPPIKIRKEDIIFHSVTQLTIKIRGAAHEELTREVRTGQYKIKVKFADGSEILSPILTIASKKRPVPIEIFPKDDETLFDELELLPQKIDGETRYFLKITYNNIENKLTFNGDTGLINMRDTSTVSALGSYTSIIDKDFLTFIQSMEGAKKQEYIDKYLFIKDESLRIAHLFIPIMPLSSSNTYYVSIDQDIIRYTDMPMDEGGNSKVIWTFSTMNIPFIKDVNIGSVPEDYDEKEPILLTGDFFYESSIRVYFNLQEAERVSIKEGPEGTKYLEVFLPKGTKRLTAGIYDITAANDGNHKIQKLGSLSVVKSGTFIPNENYNQKVFTSVGQVQEALYTSEGTLIMRPNRCNGERLELDMDYLMGQDTWVRKLMPAKNGTIEIETLIVKSQWAEIELINFEMQGYLLIGRADPSLVNTLKSKLGEKVPKSNFIQISGQDFTIDSAVLTIPYKNTDGRAIKALRYDEELRKYIEIDIIKNPIEHTAQIISTAPGIFIIVE